LLCFVAGKKGGKQGKGIVTGGKTTERKKGKTNLSNKICRDKKNNVMVAKRNLKVRK